MKKVLFVIHDNVIDPLGVMYLISNTLHATFEVFFVKEENFESKIRTVNPLDYDIIALSTITGSHIFHNKVAGYFKKINSKIISIMGGPHPTFFPKESIQLSNIDCICIGEGFVAFQKFINDESSPNIIFKEQEIISKLEKLVDINQIQEPDRDTIYRKENRSSNTIRNFMGSFGCPFNCSYCFNNSYHLKYPKEPRVRFKQPEKFVEEIVQTVQKYKTDLVYIQDDTFIINQEWFSSVTSLLKERVNLPYHCHIRCDIANEETIKKLKETGCKSVTFAVENHCHNYRKKYLNRNMTNEKILKVASWLHKYKIKFRIENMVGLPFSSLKDDILTAKFNHQCKPTIGWASLYQPYINTKLGNLCKEKGLWDGEIDKINPSFFDSSCLSIDKKKEVENFQKIFSLVVQFNFPIWLVIILTKLPLTQIYKTVYLSFKKAMYQKLYL